MCFYTFLSVEKMTKIYKFLLIFGILIYGFSCLNPFEIDSEFSDFVLSYLNDDNYDSYSSKPNKLNLGGVSAFGLVVLSFI